MVAQRRSHRDLFIRLSILCCLLVLTFNLRSAGVAHDDADTSDLIILRSITPVDGSDTEMRPLDPQTLADESTSFVIDPGIMPWSVVFSSDGQTVAGLSLTPNQEIIIKRGLDGPIVSRIATEGAIWPEALSADGSKLLVTVNSESGSLEWRTFDSTTGALKAKFTPKLRDIPFPNVQVVDRVAWKLYRLEPGGIESIDYYNTTGPANLVVMDLATGDELAHVPLPDVLAGTTIDRSDSNNWVSHFTMPGIAISSDGTEIAVVSATDDEITLVNTATMSIKQTLTMHQQTGLVDRLFALLPLAPQTALAKASEGAVRSVFYAADGDHLYVSGNQSEYQNDVESDFGLGLSLVDLNDGEIESHVLDGVAVSHIAETSSGNLYVTGIVFRPENQDFPYGFIVARLEGDASNVLAERTVEENAVLILAPNAHS